MKNIQLKNKLIQVINDKGILNFSEFNHSDSAERYVISLCGILKTVNSIRVNDFLLDLQLVIKQKNIPVFKYETVTKIYKAWLTTPHICDSLIYFAKKVRVKINSEEVWNAIISKSSWKEENLVNCRCFIVSLFFRNKIILNREAINYVPVIHTILELPIDKDNLEGSRRKAEKGLKTKYHFLLFWSQLIAEKSTLDNHSNCNLLKSILYGNYAEPFDLSYYKFISAITDKVEVEYVHQYNRRRLDQLYRVYKINPSILELSLSFEKADDAYDIIDCFFKGYVVSGLFRQNIFTLNKMEEEWFFHLLKGNGMHTAKNLPLPLTKKAAHIFRQFERKEKIGIKKGFVLASFISLGVSKEFGYDAIKSIRNMKHSQFWVTTVSNFYKKGLVSADLALVMDYINNQVFNLKNNINWKHKTVNNLLKDSEQWHADLFYQEELKKEKNRKKGNRYFTKSRISNFSIEKRALNGSIEKYSIKQLNSSNELYSEGRQLSHCIYSYRSHCEKNSCQIFSLSIIAENYVSKPQITIELRNKDIYQARGKFNRKPYDNELEIIKLWAQEEGLACYF